MNDSFYLDKVEPIKSCLLTLRDVILSSDKRLVETVKYGMPCFCLGKQAVCYLWTDKKSGEPYILVVDGNKLNHPALESGTRKRMKTLTVSSKTDLDLPQINEVLQLMLQLYV